MSCESCTGCFEAAPCSAPAPSVNGHVSKEYRQFLKAARICSAFQQQVQQQQQEQQEQHQLQTDLSEMDTLGADDRKQREAGKKEEREEHAFNSLISILASNQFTAQTYLAHAYKQLGAIDFLQLARSLAHHGFWGRLITWAFLYVREDSKRLRSLLDKHDVELLQNVNDEAEMFEVFNPAVSCQRVAWSTDPIPPL